MGGSKLIQNQFLEGKRSNCDFKMAFTTILMTSECSLDTLRLKLWSTTMSTLWRSGESVRLVFQRLAVWTPAQEIIHSYKISGPPAFIMVHNQYHISVSLCKGSMLCGISMRPKYPGLRWPMIVLYHSSTQTHRHTHTHTLRFSSLSLLINTQAHTHIGWLPDEFPKYHSYWEFVWEPSISSLLCTHTHILTQTTPNDFFRATSRWASSYSSCAPLWTQPPSRWAASNLSHILNRPS
jgi:hypothetical protein